MKPKSTADNPPPYPRIGELYRAVAGALDTKAQNRKVDRLAREGEFDWSLLSELSDELINAPLGKYIDADFGSFMRNHLDHACHEYLGLVSAVPLDSLNRAEAMPLLVEHYFSPLGAMLIYEFKKEFGGPNLMRFLDADEHPIRVVVKWFEDESQISIAKQAFPQSTDTDKSYRETFHRWINGTQIPDLLSIKLLSDKLLEKVSSEKKNAVLNMCRWMLLARALLWLESKPSIPFRNFMRRYLLLGMPAIDTGQILFRAMHDAGTRYEPLKLPAGSLYEKLNRTTEKSLGERHKTKAELDDLVALTEELDFDGRTHFLIEWLHGRWHALSGMFEEAMACYERAVDLGNYRAGANQKEIVKEALAIAAHIKRKTALNRLKHLAVAFQLFEEPSDSDVIQDWEIEQFQQQFYRLFPAQGRFPEALSSDDDVEPLPILVMSQEEMDRIRPDLTNPERRRTISFPSGQKRRWHQLRLFASFGRAEEVEVLLKHGACVNQLDDSGASALLTAIQYANDKGDRKALDLLLRNKHETETLNSQTDKKKLTPLICAVEYGEPDVVERILDLGATADIEGNYPSRTPLYLCIETIGALRNPNLIYQRMYTSLMEDNDRVMQEIRRRENISIGGVYGEGKNIQALLANPRNLEWANELCIAMANDFISRHSEEKLVKIAELLLKKGANPNFPHQYPESGRTPLMLAAESNSVKTFDLMMRYGGYPYQTDSSGQNCIRIAFAFRSAEIMHYLRAKNIH